MGKRKHVKKPSVKVESEAEVMSVLNAIVLPLSDELMDQLVKEGWQREKLELYKAWGFGYCRERESFIELDAHFVDLTNE